MKNNPFGDSQACDIFWEMIYGIPKNHREYITSKYSKFSKTLKELKKHDITGKEPISQMLKHDFLKQAGKYLTTESAKTHLANVLTYKIRKTILNKG